jgi:hypothetical protein
MTIATQKKLWWSALALGIGGTGIFFVLVLLHRSFPSGPEKWLNLWPVVTFVLAVVSVFVLRRLYRIEPAPAGGFYQLGLADLVLASMLCGLVLTIGQVVSEERFLRIVVPLAMASGATFVVGLLLAARRGIASDWCKRYFALGFTLALYGAVVVGGVFVFLCVAAFYGETLNVLQAFLFGDVGRPYLQMRPFFLAALAFLPLGVASCVRAVRLNRERLQRDSARETASGKEA